MLRSPSVSLEPKLIPLFFLLLFSPFHKSSRKRGSRAKGREENREGGYSARIADGPPRRRAPAVGRLSPFRRRPHGLGEPEEDAPPRGKKERGRDLPLIYVCAAFKYAGCNMYRIASTM